MRLVPDAKDAWRWHSTRAMAAAAAFPAVWNSLPDDLKSRVPDSAMIYIMVAFVLAGMIGRVIEQG